MAAIRLQALRKNYGAVNVIPGIDLTIEDREFVVFVGPSGCGKSTLLRIIAGLEPVDGGDLYIGERRVNDVPPAQRDIAMVFQDYALYPHMTVRDNMAFGLEMRNTPKDEIERRVRRAAEQLHIVEVLDRKPRALSGGQRQRVAMGRAMVREPQVFLFDEPLSNLDAKLRGEVRTEIKALAQTLRTTMVFVTHDQVEAMTMADRIVILRAGVVQQVGTPQQVYNEPANAFVASFIGSPTINVFAAQRDGDGHGDGASLRLADGTTLALPAPRAATLGERRGVQLAVRPEHLRLQPAGPGAVPVTVGVVEPLGSDTLVYFDFDGRRLVARVPPEHTPAAGDTVHLGIALDRAHVFDADSGLALR